LCDRGFEVDAGVLSAEVRNLPDRALDPRPHAPVLRKTCCGCTRTELVEYVAAQHRALPPDDRRRRICERCLDERCGRATLVRVQGLACTGIARMTKLSRYGCISGPCGLTTRLKRPREAALAKEAVMPSSMSLDHQLPFNLGQPVRRRTHLEGPVGVIVGFVFIPTGAALVRWTDAGGATFEKLDELIDVRINS